MPARKIQDEAEIIRWFNDGWTYPEMVAEYLRKYQLQTTPTMFANFRRLRGLDPRQDHDATLIPWRVRTEHKFAYPLSILRWEAQVRQGKKLGPEQAVKHGNFLARLERDGLVIDYDPATREGFHLVPRMPMDSDVIRRPRGVHAQS